MVKQAIITKFKVFESAKSLPNTMYHFTPKKNVKSILKNGLLPKHKPNREYYTDEFTSNAVYLTDTSLTSSVNLPRTLDFAPVTILKIDISNLDKNKFVVDDDYYDMYMKNKPNIDMNVEIHKIDNLLASLDTECSIAYEGEIPKENISVYK